MLGGYADTGVADLEMQHQLLIGLGLNVNRDQHIAEVREL